MADILTKIRNLVRRGRVTRAGSDAGQYATTQVEYMGKPVNVALLNPYGVATNPPVDSLSIVWQVQGQEENRVAMAYSPDKRPKNLKEGEVALGNFLLGKFFKFNEDGTVSLNTDLVINGDLTVTGATALSATVTSNSVDISDTHTHGGVDTGPGDTGPPN